MNIKRILLVTVAILLPAIAWGDHGYELIGDCYVTTEQPASSNSMLEHNPLGCKSWVGGHYVVKNGMGYRFGYCDPDTGCESGYVLVADQRSVPLDPSCHLTVYWCEICPDPYESKDGRCYIPKNKNIEDKLGTFHYTSDCEYEP